MQIKNWGLITKVSGIIIFLAVVWLGYVVYQGCRLGIDAEYELQAMSFMSHLLVQYIETHDGKWPSSWHDLELIDPQYHNLAWPKSRHDVAECVIIDFTADPALLAKQDSQSFAAFQARRNYYPYDHDKLRVIEALRKRHGTGTTRKATSP